MKLSSRASLVVVFEADHPSFVNQPAPDEHVWRYMDLARFVSMLSSRSLHFVRVDLMQDRWEGTTGPLNRALRPGWYGKDYEGWLEEALPRLTEYGRTHTHISCWYRAERESAAMWDIYQREGRGVAIRSTWAKLTSSLRSERLINGAMVRYVDYSTTAIPEGNMFDRFLYKRESFAHEQEVRLVMATGRSGPDPAGGPDMINLGPEDPVIPIPIDLDAAIEGVWIAPDQQPWITDVVGSLVEQYAFRFDIHQSDLSSDPVD